MRAINASEEAHRKILKNKQMMEAASGKGISMSKALDVLLGEKKDV